MQVAYRRQIIDAALLRFTKAGLEAAHGEGTGPI